MDWNWFIKALHGVAGSCHRIMPACPEGRVLWFEEKWGRLHPTLRSMFSKFNGTELFIEAIPMLTILGISLDPPQSRVVWPLECCIDYWMISWRAPAEGGLPICRTNYDSLWIFDRGQVREWDSVRGAWVGGDMPFQTWLQKIIEDGIKYQSDGL